MPMKSNNPEFKGVRQKLMHEDKGRYYHIMLNMADDDLDPYEYRLLGHYVRVGECWENIRTTARKTKISTGKVSMTRDALQTKGYIRIEYRGKDTCLVTVIDRMAENVQRYQKQCSPDEHVHDMNTDVHQMNTNVHEVKQRITIEEEPKKKQPQRRNSRKSTPVVRDDIYNTIADVWNVFGDLKVVSIRNTLTAVMGELTVDEIRAFGAYMAKQSWLEEDKSNMPSSEETLPTWVGRFRAVKATPKPATNGTNGNLQNSVRQYGLSGETSE